MARIVSPLLVDEASLKAVVDPRASTAGIEQAVVNELTAARPSSRVKVVYSDYFHDRFWVADRASGVIMGKSLNSKIFFIETLSSQDVARVVSELGHLSV